MLTQIELDRIARDLVRYALNEMVPNEGPLIRLSKLTLSFYRTLPIGSKNSYTFLPLYCSYFVVPSFNDEEVPEGAGLSVSQKLNVSIFSVVEDQSKFIESEIKISLIRLLRQVMKIVWSPLFLEN